jgi:hypothetical protein
VDLFTTIMPYAQRLMMAQAATTLARALPQDAAD